MKKFKIVGIFFIVSVIIMGLFNFLDYKNVINKKDVLIPDSINKKIKNPESTILQENQAMEKVKPNNINAESSLKNSDIEVYFGGKDAFLQEKKINLPSNVKNKEAFVFNKVKELNKELKDVKLLFIKTENGICNIDLSKEFLNTLQGTAGETLIIYSIVNSLTELENIKKVQFYIEGNKGFETGHQVYYEPIGKSYDINE